MTSTGGIVATKLGGGCMPSSAAALASNVRPAEIPDWIATPALTPEFEALKGGAPATCTGARGSAAEA
jgi:hypothetical protein